MSAMLRTLAAVMVLAASQASAATGDWPQYGFTAKGDRDNTQETILSRKTVPHLVKKWSANIQDVISGAVVANGIVYVHSIDGHLSARDAKTGAPIWQVMTGVNISSPAVADGLVYVGAGDGGVYAFDAETGAALVGGQRQRPCRYGSRDRRRCHLWRHQLGLRDSDRCEDRRHQMGNAASPLRHGLRAGRRARHRLFQCRR